MKKEFKVQELIDVLNGMESAGIRRVPSLEAKTTMTKEKIDIYRPKPEDYKRVLGATLAWDRPVEWVDFPEGTDAMVTGRRLAAKIKWLGWRNNLTVRHPIAGIRAVLEGIRKGGTSTLQILAVSYEWGGTQMSVATEVDGHQAGINNMIRFDQSFNPCDEARINGEAMGRALVNFRIQKEGSHRPSSKCVDTCDNPYKCREAWDLHLLKLAGQHEC